LQYLILKITQVATTQIKNLFSTIQSLRQEFIFTNRMDQSTPIQFDFNSEEPKEFLSGRSLAQPEPKPKSTRGRKSSKELDLEMENVQVPEDEILFKKQYYGIGDVAKMFGVKASVIRYWENEFDVLEPRKNRKGDRLFKPTDIKNLQIIYDLLRRRKFTLEGAKEYMKDSQKAEEKYALIQSLQKVRAFLLELKAHL
jgi:DNA-binding transcriptional MerR regulator